MAKTIDARGLSCPQPVMMVLDAIKADDTKEMVVMVDTDTAKENVMRAAANRGWTVADICAGAGTFSLTIKKS
jgi:TusA-related sulfurtransferase